MNKPPTSDRANQRFDEAVRAYAPPAPRKWQILLTLKPGIAELRRKGASYRAITEILRAADVPVSCRTVARFCHDVLHPRRPQKQGRPASRQQPAEPQQPFAPPANTGGPRIADPRTI
ncbi:MAG TPA: hypothetical protein VMP11_13045 [Verrucomicrobiae bacterium]|nr:hypothetical protein [Verrucomicrobiae bacterium]